MTYLPTGNAGFDRQQRITNARGNAIARALQLSYEWMDSRNRNENVAFSDANSFDDACKELARLLNEPEVCPSCGQEVKHGETHP